MLYQEISVALWQIIPGAATSVCSRKVSKKSKMKRNLRKPEDVLMTLEKSPVYVGDC